MKKNALILALALSFLPTSWAYEPKITHSDLSRAALNKSSLNIDPTLLPNLGLKPISINQIFLHNGTFSNLEGLFVFGALHEDDGKRAFNHFYDPFYNRPLTVLGVQPGSIFGVPNLKSPDWALEENDIFEQSYSYHDARDAFYKALTYNENTPLGNVYVRSNYWGNTFSKLGQVIHHIQDMAQPQHVRNDAHLDKFEFFGFNPLYNPSSYEIYTANEDEKIDKKILGLAFGPDSNAVFPGSSEFKTPRDFWKNSAGSGMAEFTNRNFVSQGTNFLLSFFGNVVTAKYPLPRPGTPTNYSIDQLYQDQGGSTPAGIKAICSDVLINCAMTMYPSALSQKASTLSIFDQDMQAKSLPVTYDDGVSTSTYSVSRLFALNRFNFDDAHSILIPKAVGYSAGLINYFFRGKLEISAPDEVIYGIIDPTQKDSFAQIKLKLKNTTPNEDMTGGTFVAIAKFHRNECYRSDLTGEAGAPGGIDIVGCRSQFEEIVLSAPQSVTLVSGANPQAFTFDFSQSPIPVNATDLFLQVVYRGKLGDELDAVVVTTKDLFEPTHIAYLNGTDVTQLNDVYYPWQQIVAGVNAGDPRFDLVDFDGNHTYNPLYDWRVEPTDWTNVRISFAGPTVFKVATIPSLPNGRFARMTVLTDKSVLKFYPDQYEFSLPPAFNQVNDAGTIFFVTASQLFRGAYVTNMRIIVSCIPTGSCNGSLRSIPTSIVADALVPMPVTFP